MVKVYTFVLTTELSKTICVEADAVCSAKAQLESLYKAGAIKLDGKENYVSHKIVSKPGERLNAKCFIIDNEFVKANEMPDYNKIRNLVGTIRGENLNNEYL